MIRLFKKIICLLTHHDLKEPCQKKYVINMFAHIHYFKCNRCQEWLKQSIQKGYSSIGDFFEQQFPEQHKTMKERNGN